MLRLKSGDTSALSSLVHRYQNQLLNASFKFLLNLEQAEDVTQQTFIKVLESAKKYKPTASFKTWIYTILLNLCRDKFRYSTKQPTISLEQPERNSTKELNLGSTIADPSQVTPHDLAEKSELQQVIRSALAALPESQREALVLKEFGQFSYKEIAETLEVTEKAVDSLLLRARENMRKALKPYLQSEVSHRQRGHRGL